MTTIPTLSQLYDDIIADLESEWGDSIPVFGRVFLVAVAAVQAAKLKIFYLALGDIQKNIFPDTADQESSGGTLERFGRLKLGRNPFTATSAQYSVEVTGTIGASISVSTVFKSNDDSLSPGKFFILDAPFVFIAGTGIITLRALESGLGSKLQVGDQLTATAPIANVESIGEVTAETATPLSAEDIEDYRNKTVESYRLEANGGSGSDYRLWAADAQGVLRVYPYAKSGYPAEINLFVEATIADSVDGKGTPTTAILNAVESVVELDPDTSKPISERGRRPVGVHQVHYLPIVLQTIVIDINGLAAIAAGEKTLIADAIVLMISTIRPFAASADAPANKNDILDVNKIISEILNTRPGSSFGTVVLKVNTISVPSVTLINGQIPWVQNVNFL